MKNLNFNVKSEIALTFESRYIDLHSNFDLVGFHYSLEGRLFEMSWKRSVGEWARREPIDSLKIQFIGVSVLAMKARDAGFPTKEDSCLSFVGYLHPDDLEVMDGFLPESSADESYHMIFCFMSDASIKIFADEVRLSEVVVAPYVPYV